MKLLRSLSMIVTLALIITVGGVYAVWTYVQHSDVPDINPEITVAMGDVKFDGSSGSYSIDTSNLTLVVEPTKIGDETHHTSLYASGYLVIKFTPNENATQTIKDYGVQTTYNFALSGENWKHNGTAIFTRNSVAEASGTIAVTESAGGVWTSDWQLQSDGSLTYTISAADIAKVFTISDWQLDTKTKYDAFALDLAKGNFIIQISDGVHS